MKAAAFAYRPVASLAEAFAIMAEHGDGAKLLAGGQSLVPALNLRLMAPGMLIDLNGVAELKGVSVVAGRLRLGALTRHVEIERSEVIAQWAPLLAEAVRHIAHPAIRNRGTLGGNLVHADPASEFPACMVALEAEMVMASAAGERRMAAEQFFTGIYETALREGEILVAVELPAGVEGQRHAFIELARRSGDYALVGIACRAIVNGTTLSELRPVFFACGPHPLVARRAASQLVGTVLDDAALNRATEALAGDLEPQDDLQVTAPVRLHLARTLLRRAVAILVPDLVASETRKASA